MEHENIRSGSGRQSAYQRPLIILEIKFAVHDPDTRILRLEVPDYRVVDTPLVKNTPKLES